MIKTTTVNAAQRPLGLHALYLRTRFIVFSIYIYIYIYRKNKKEKKKRKEKRKKFENRYNKTGALASYIRAYSPFHL
jgi:large-conductance mechanosensitive channel